MLGFVLKRVVAMPLLVLGVITVTFLLSAVTKGDPLTAIISEQQMDNPEVVAAARRHWGLDRPLYERYLIYLSNLAQGDFGTSFVTKRNVASDILERLPATLELVMAAMIIGVAAGIVLGVAAAHWRDGIIDNAVRLFALIGSSIPLFWSGLILLYLFSVTLGWLPGPGRLDPRDIAPPHVTGFFLIDSLIAGDPVKFGRAFYHLLLPAFVLGWTEIGIISRLVRANMLDVLNQDYVRTARAKGVGERGVLFGHALRNTMIPTLTVIGHSFAHLITGAVLTETVFGWPGMGSYAVGAAQQLDYPAIVAVTIIGSVSFLLASLATDISYAFANPKIRLS